MSVTSDCTHISISPAKHISASPVTNGYVARCVGMVMALRNTWAQNDVDAAAPRIARVALPIVVADLAPVWAVGVRHGRRVALRSARARTQSVRPRERSRFRGMGRGWEKEGERRVRGLVLLTTPVPLLTDASRERTTMPPRSKTTRRDPNENCPQDCPETNRNILQRGKPEKGFDPQQICSHRHRLTPASPPTSADASAASRMARPARDRPAVGAMSPFRRRRARKEARGGTERNFRL